MNPKLRLLLWGLLAIGFFAATILLWGRLVREEKNKQVEMVFDYAALRDLARAQGEELDLKKYGTSFAVAELKLDDLENQGVAVALEGLQLAIMLKLDPDQSKIDPSKTYLYFMKPDSLESIEAALKLALGDKKVRRLGEEPYLEIDADMRILPTLGLGFPKPLVEELTKQGFRIWLRPENKPQANNATVTRAYEEMAKLQPSPAPNTGGIAGVIFGGAANEAVGYPQGLDAAADELKRNGWKLGLIELMPGAQQKGIEYLVRKMPEQTVRVFAVSPAQQEKLKPDRVIGMFSLAARERNLRVLYVRPYAYDPSPEKGMEDANQLLFEGIKSELHGMEGNASVFDSQYAWKPNAVLLAGVAAGAGAATWLLLAELWPALPLGVRRRWPAVPVWLGAIIVVGLAGVTGASAFLGSSGQLWRTLMALGTGCVVPTLAMVCHFGFLDRAGARESRSAVLMWALALLWRTSLLSLSGALMAASYLEETTFMLGLDTFRGVKLLTLGVPVLVVLAWLVREGVVLPWLNAPLKLYHVVGLGILAVLALFYTLRTGNMGGEAGGDALEHEKNLRLWLDQNLGVRPRFKEFMLAHPAMVLCPVVLWLRWRPLLPLVLLAAAIGQAGMADTFAHIHTPLLISLKRSLLGVALGGVVGAVLGSLLMLVPRRNSP